MSQKLSKGTTFQFHSADSIGVIVDYSPANVNYYWKHAPEQQYNMSVSHFNKYLAVVNPA